MRKDSTSLGWRVIILIALILIIDQIVKVYIKTSFSPLEKLNVIDGFFQLYYIENRGMAFGTTLGSGAMAKYALSIFRLVAIIGIGYYIYKLLRENNVHSGLIYSVGLIFAGATGNLIDGMFYDFIWDVNPDVAWNWAEDKNGQWIVDSTGNPVIRPHGFLLGSVVDMFQFTTRWPEGMPFGLGGKEIFGAIWNVADGSITLGVGIIIARYRTFFKKQEDTESDEAETTPSDDAPQSTPQEAQ
ncbi:MAG: signal peptidase II [Crocinitomicaceae bacterium]